MKKILSLVLSLAMVAAMCVCGSLTAFASTTGSGTPGDPYVITEAPDEWSTLYSSGDYIKLANDITSEAGLVVGSEELTIDLNGFTLTIPFIALSGNAVLNISGGTITSAPYPTSHTQNMISLNNTSVLNAENMYLLAGKENDSTLAPYAVCADVGTNANLTNCYVKGGDSDAVNGDFIAPGAALVTYGGTVTLSDCTLAMGNGGDWVTNPSCTVFEIYNSGAVKDKGGNAITPAPFTVSDTKVQKIGTGYPVTTVSTDTITSISSGSNSASADVGATYVAGSGAATVYSVDIAWDSMAFTYTAGSAGTWNPETHDYDAATTAAWSQTNNTVTVTNHSNAAVDATLSYAKEAAYTDISGTFTEASGTANDGKLELATAAGTTPANAPTATAALKLSGALAAGVADTKIGTVTVTITAHKNVSDAQDGGIYGRG